MKSEHFSTLLEGLSLVSKKRQNAHHQNSSDDSEEIAEFMANIGVVPLKEFCGWIAKSFRSFESLVNAVDEAANSNEMSNFLLDDINLADAGTLKKLANHYGVSFEKKATKDAVSKKLISFLKKKIGKPIQDSRQGINFNVDHVKDILSEDLTVSKLKQFDDLHSFFQRFQTVEASKQYVFDYAKSCATTAIGFYVLENSDEIPKGYLPALLDELKVADLKKLAGYYFLPKTGTQASLVKSIKSHLKISPLDDAALVEAASEEYLILEQQVGADITIEEGWNQLAIRLGVFNSSTIRGMADAKKINASGNRAKMLSAIGNHLRRVAVSRTRG